MKVNNNSTKGALAALSMATVVGGWAAMGSGDQSQGDTTQDWGEESSQVLTLATDAVNQVPVAEMVPLAVLLNADAGYRNEVLFRDLPPIPDLIKPEQRKRVDLEPLSQLPTLSSLTQATSTPAAGQTTKAQQGVAITPASSPNTAPLPVLSILPTLPTSSSLGQVQPLPAQNFPPLPSAPSATQQVAPAAPKPKPAVRTKSSR